MNKLILSAMRRGSRTFSVLLLFFQVIVNAPGGKAAAGEASFADTGSQSVADKGRDLFIEATPKRLIPPRRDPTVTRARFIKVRLELLAPPGTNSTSGISRILILNLFPDVRCSVRLERCERRSSRSFTWVGTVQNEKDSEVTLSIHEGVLAGNIRFSGGFYQIRYAGQAIHTILQIDPTRFPPEKEPRRPG